MIINLVAVFTILINQINKRMKWKIFVRMILIKIRSFKSGIKTKTMKGQNKENTNILKIKTTLINNLIFCNINNKKTILLTLTQCQTPK